MGYNLDAVVNKAVQKGLVLSNSSKSALKNELEGKGKLTVTVNGEVRTFTATEIVNYRPSGVSRPEYPTPSVQSTAKKVSEAAHKVFKHQSFGSKLRAKLQDFALRFSKWRNENGPLKKFFRSIFGSQSKATEPKTPPPARPTTPVAKPSATAVKPSKMSNLATRLDPRKSSLCFEYLNSSLNPDISARGFSSDLYLLNSELNKLNQIIDRVNNLKNEVVKTQVKNVIHLFTMRSGENQPGKFKYVDQICEHIEEQIAVAQEDLKNRNSLIYQQKLPPGYGPIGSADGGGGSLRSGGGSADTSCTIVY